MKIKGTKKQSIPVKEEEEEVSMLEGNSMCARCISRPALGS